MTPIRWFFLVAALGLVLAGAAGGRAFIASYSTAVAEARAARAETIKATQVAYNAEVVADSLRIGATQAISASRAAAQRADSLVRVTAQLKTNMTALVMSAPDICRPALAAADAVIASQDSTIAALQTAHTADSAVAANLTIALDTTQAALRQLRSAATQLVRADAVLEKHIRPAWYVRILPTPGVGVGAGFDARGELHTVVGVTLSWKF